MCEPFNERSSSSGEQREKNLKENVYTKHLATACARIAEWLKFRNSCGPGRHLHWSVRRRVHARVMFNNFRDYRDDPNVNISKSAQVYSYVGTLQSFGKLCNLFSLEISRFRSAEKGLQVREQGDENPDIRVKSARGDRKPKIYLKYKSSCACNRERKREKQ